MNASPSKLAQAELMARLVHLSHRLASADKADQCNAYTEMLGLATEGSHDAMYAVARCLVKGTGVEQDAESGHYWLERSCLSIHSPRQALLSLGLLHIDHAIRGANPKYGIELIGQSASRGCEEALTELLRHCGDSTLGTAACKATYRVLAERALVDEAESEILITFRETYPSPAILDS